MPSPIFHGLEFHLKRDVVKHGRLHHLLDEALRINLIVQQTGRHINDGRRDTVLKEGSKEAVACVRVCGGGMSGGVWRSGGALVRACVCVCA